MLFSFVRIKTLDPRSGSGMTDKSKNNDTGFTLKTFGHDRQKERREACGGSGGRKTKATTKDTRSFALLERGPFVSAKGPQTMGARAWPYKMALSCHSELVLSEAKDLAGFDPGCGGYEC